MTVKLVEFKASLSAKDRVIKMLEEYLEEAKNNEIDSALLIIKRADGQWTWILDGDTPYSDMIGRLEIAKTEIVMEIFKKNNIQ